MNIRRVILGLIFASIFSRTADAQVGTFFGCAFPFSPDGRDGIAISPPAPNSTQTVSLRAISFDVLPTALSAKVQGAKIDVTMEGGFNGFDAPTGCGVVNVGLLAPGNYTINYFVAILGSSGPVLRLTSQFIVSDRNPQPNYQGMWWAAPAGSESGWGINFAHEGDTIVATWFTYGGDGRSMWFVMTAKETATDTYSGTLYATQGSLSVVNPFRPGTFTATPWGTGTLKFIDADNATFTYPIPGGPPLPPPLQTKAITRQVFGPLPTCEFGVLPNMALATNFTDLWWAAPADSEPGWGINFSHQGDTIFATWFTYYVTGSPMWLVATARQAGPGLFVGTLYRTSGPAAFANPFDPAKVVATPVGSVTLRFIDGNNATMFYTVQLPELGFPIADNRKVTREIFAAPGTVCQ